MISAGTFLRRQGRRRRMIRDVDDRGCPYYPLPSLAGLRQGGTPGCGSSLMISTTSTQGEYFATTNASTAEPRVRERHKRRREWKGERMQSCLRYVYYFTPC